MYVVVRITMVIQLKNKLIKDTLLQQAVTDLFPEQWGDGR